jgi:hypothetical protein
VRTSTSTSFKRPTSRAERDPLVESAILVSDDGLNWRFRGLFQEDYGDETAFLFEPNGSIFAIARSGAGRNAQVCRANLRFIASSESTSIATSEVRSSQSGETRFSWVAGKTKNGPPRRHSTGSRKTL